MNRWLISLFLFGAILTPPIHLVSGLPALRLEILAVLWVILSRKTSLKGIDHIGKLFIFLIFIASVSIVCSYLIFDTPFNFRDLMILPMLVQYWFIYFFARSIRGSNLRLHAVKMAAVFVGVSAVVGIFQKFNIADINNWLTPHYIYAVTKEQTLRALLSEASFGRVVGTVGDPRHYAYVLAVGIAATLPLILNVKKTKRLLYASIALICFIAALFAVSRTGFAAFILVFLIGAYLRSTSTKLLVKYLFLAGISLPILFGVWFSYAPQDTQDRLLSIDSGSYEHSLHARQRDVLEPVKKGMEQPFIFITGRGPSKSVLPGSEHSDMGWMLMRYGLFGLACYLAILYRSFKSGIRRYRVASLQEEKIVLMFAVMSIGVWFLFAQAESIFKLSQIMSINMFVLGLVFAKPYPLNADLSQQHKQRFRYDN